MHDRVFRFDTAGFQWTCAHEGQYDVAVSRVLQTQAINWIDLVCLPAGHSVGTHTHGLDDEEIYIVISGTGTMTVEDDDVAVRAGDVVHNPPGGTHGLVNSGESELRVVVVGVPSSDGATEKYVEREVVSCKEE